MNQRSCTTGFAGLVVWGLTLTPPLWAAAPTSPWTAKDIGAPAVAGSTDAPMDPNGVCTLTGSGGGSGIWYEDSFQFAYQSIKGDGSITAQFLSLKGGDPGWANAGLLIRANDTDSSPKVAFTMTPHGLT